MNIITILSGNFRELTEIIQKSLDVLGKNVQHLDNVLETLEIFQHSLGILAILLVKLNLLSAANTNEYQEVLFSQIQEFINVCNPDQIRHAGDLCKFTKFNILIKFYFFSYCGY